jgi:hemerythrin superfamily protein
VNVSQQRLETLAVVSPHFVDSDRNGAYRATLVDGRISGPTDNPGDIDACRKREQHDMDAIALLKADHRKVEELFDKFESAKGESSKLKIAQQICMELSIHARIEEEIFYPACTGEVEDADLVDEAYVEHDGAKVLIAEIAGSNPSQHFYDAKVKVLSELIKHHVKEEEKRAEGLFAEAKDAGLDMDALGERLRKRKKELVMEYKAALPAPETRSFTGHELKQGEPVERAA